MNRKLTHIDSKGEARMVDVSDKPIQQRTAVARGEIRMAAATLRLVRGDKIAKGNVLATARIAAIQAAKRTADLIPMCHPLAINHCEVEFDFPKSGNTIVITSTVKVNGQTGVEMEALTAVNLAALTIYDMCKAVDKKMRITNVKLVSKAKK
tara:strand:- start:34 stop:489 length:456 start_codon:yes stop_codon:yes gene_type:complete